MKKCPLALLALLVAVSAEAQPKVYMITDLSLMDPHTFASLPLFGCNDVTNSVPLNLAPSINDTITDNLTTDGDNDGMLDLTPVIASLNAEDPATGYSPGGEITWDLSDPGGELAFHFAACTAPQSSAVCEQDPTMPVEYSFFQNAVGGTCLTPHPGTTTGYSPAIIEPVAPCFVSDPFRLSMEVAGLKLKLEDSRIAATYIGDPATDLMDGLIVGFLPEAAADTILISATVPFVGGQPVSSILPGGTGSCASGDDRDLGVDGVTMGWWLHFNFVATETPWAPTGAPMPMVTAGSGLRLDGPAPNPFRGETQLAYFVPRPGNVRVNVHDVTGRLIATLADGDSAPGRHTASWSGATRDGSAAAPGIYFVRLEWGGEARTQRVIHLR